MRKVQDDIQEAKIDYSDISVQDLYRPVLKERVPDIPNKNPDDPDYKWWKEQIKRCENGWIAPNGHYLNGYLYFYLNFCKVPILPPGGSRLEPHPPLYRDNDEDILNQIWANTGRLLPNGKWYNAKNHIEAKPRGIAWSTFTLLGVGMWTFVFKNDKRIGCAYPNDDIIEGERQWFKDTWHALHPMFKRWKGQDYIPIHDSEKLFSVGYKTGTRKHAQNFCHFDVVGQEIKAGTYKGKRLNLMIAAEAGLWVGQSLRNYYTENEPALKLGTTQWGMLLIGGTSNAVINKSTTYKEMFESPESFNATRHFTPKTRVLFGHIDYKTGKSNEVTALAEIRALRESKLGDPNAYLQETVENPLNWKEAFLPNNKSAIYNSALINDHISWIKENHADKWAKGSIEPELDIYNKPTGKYRFLENSHGDWYINLEGTPKPEYENLHVAGIDDRYKTRGSEQKVTREGSKNCMIIYRKPTLYEMKSDMPVAMYFGNAPDMVVAYEEFYKGMLFYDIQKTLYEYNSEGFIMFLREKKALNRLYHINGLPGIHIVSAEHKAELTYLGTQYFTAGRYKNITLPLILEEIGKWSTGVNTDIASAFHVVLKLLQLTETSYVTKQKELDERPQTVVIQLGPTNKSTEIRIGTDYPIIRLGRGVG